MVGPQARTEAVEVARAAVDISERRACGLLLVVRGTCRYKAVARPANDELRQKFVDFTVPQARFLDLAIPDPLLRWDEVTQHHEFGPIDWTEFDQVLKGNGPCNAERLAARRSAHAAGAWVREAASAHAEKQRQRSATMAA